MRLRNLIPCKAKLIIYKSSILPHLTYCRLVWHNCRSSDSGKIERIQERALKAVFNSHSESEENLLVRADNTINYGKHSLRYQGPYIWSRLDNKLKDSSNIAFFKKNIRKKRDLTSLLNNKNSCCNLCNS